MTMTDCCNLCVTRMDLPIFRSQ